MSGRRSTLIRAGDAAARATFKRAATEAHDWLEVRYVKAFTTPYFTNGSRWGLPVDHTPLEGLGNNFAASREGCIPDTWLTV